MMIDRKIARRVAAEHIGEGTVGAHGVTPVILDDETIELSFGWVFFYQSKEYIRDGELGTKLAGNAPIIVDRDDGSVHLTGTAKPVWHYLREYERGRSGG